MLNNTIRIRRAVQEDYKALKRMAEDMDMPFSLFMKRALTQIAEKYNNIDLKDSYDVIPEIHTSGVSRKTMTTITDICSRLNCDVSSFLKIELYRLQKDYFKNKDY